MLPQANRPQFQRGEVTVRGVCCSGLYAALRGRAASTSAPHSAPGGELGNGGADNAGGIAGGTCRPFYVTIRLGNVTARTSIRTGFSPSFTEVFPFGGNCPVRGACVVLGVVDR